MSARVIDSLFKDEETALRTLGGNFDRLANSIERIGKTQIFRSGRIRRVAELGGGTGLIGLWLVKNRLCEACDIYDHANNPIIIGEKWARLLNVDGVKFHHISYAEIAEGGQQSFDFVFTEHGASLDYLQPGTAMLDDYLNPENCPLLPCYRELAVAFKRLLGPSAYGMIGGGDITPVCAAALCTALREQHQSINWDLSSNRSGLQLFIQSAPGPLLETFKDDALAILSDAEDRREFPKQDVLCCRWKQSFAVVENT